jgi:hypothetical protein
MRGMTRLLHAIVASALWAGGCQFVAGVRTDVELNEELNDAGTPCLNGSVLAGATVDGSQTDCIDSVCKDGELIAEPDDTEIPDDGLECTVDTCAGGNKLFQPMPGASCGESGTLTCNSLGQCEGCAIAAECGTDAACRIWKCEMDNTCTTTDQPQGTLTGTQAPGDCKKTQCNGVGGEETVIDDMDAPVDTNDCTDEVCMMGMPSHPNSVQDQICGMGGVCNGSGACVQCNTPAQCPGMESFCRMRTCNTGMCGLSDTADNTALPMSDQVAGDCKEIQCNGMGGTKTVNSNNDLPVDGEECTNDVCTSGVPTNPNRPPGDGCSQDGGEVCDGNGACKKNNGTVCSSDGECVDGSCTDGVCCNTTCDTQCFSCNQANSLGTCTPVVKYDEDPNAMTTCMGMRACNGIGLCLLKDGQTCVNNGDCISGKCQGTPKVCVP